MLTGHRCTLRHHSATHLPPVLPGTSRWVKLWRYIRTLMLVDQSHPETKNYLKSYAQICNENKRQVTGCPYVIHPFSRFRKRWDLVVFVALTMHLLILVFDFTFLIFKSVDSYKTAIVFDLFLCGILVVEIGLKFITGFVVEGTNEIVLEPNRIALNYLKCCKMIYDLVAALPFILALDYFDRSFYTYDTNGYLLFMIFLYAVNIFRFYDIFRYFQILPRSFRVSEKKMLIMKVVMNTFYVLHWSACLRYILPQLAIVVEPNPEDIFSLGNSLFKTDNFSVGHFLVDVYWRHYRNEDVINYPVSEQRTIINPPTFKQYLSFYYYFRPVDQRKYDHSFVIMKLDTLRKDSSILDNYLASMMATIKLSLHTGRDDCAGLHLVNNMLTTFILIGGWIWFTYIMLIMIRTIISAEISQTRFEEFINEIKAFVFNTRLSDLLKWKMLRHFTVRFRKSYFNEHAIMEMMSDNLRRNIRLEICQNLLKNVELFHDLPLALMEDIVDYLQYEIYLENDVIIEAGTRGEALYMIASGSAAVYSRGGTELGHLIDGAHFGEISLLRKDQRRTATIIALEDCEVYKLSHDHFQNLIQPHSPLLLKMHKLAEEKTTNEQKNRDKLSEEEVYDNFLQ
ncbi:potassium/sodium hyperpolarization-activated cyclic nucleotide-gated channel 4-like [Malaya genurostris]|uniref:potassium/sodium hyperpolarization-activated cyclic nucleotide-gated channel 4-like n=1 Tax=Malaya genurostris TaxID=325434 RepID=UPI0026F3BD3D|nr:potassium/sodium hyperpolarization-activated cyclic nucleotide-gated channel 4-like [Malaya genurostris]